MLDRMLEDEDRQTVCLRVARLSFLSAFLPSFLFLYTIFVDTSVNSYSSFCFLSYS
jgi:hypothetical protein